MANKLGPRQQAAKTKRERTRAALIQAAEDLLARDPSSDLKMEEVAELAGVSKAAAYLHFDKQALIEELFNRIVAQVSDVATSESDTPTVELIDKYVHDVARVVHRHPGLAKNFTVNPRAYGKSFRGLQALIARGVERGDLHVPGGISTDELADYHSAGLMMRIVLRLDKGDTPEQTAAFVLAQLLPVLGVS